MTSDLRTRRFFDERSERYYARNYEQPHSRHAHNLAVRREVCLALVPELHGPILDLGCGPGAMTLPLLDLGHRVISTDISAKMAGETAANVRRSGHDAWVAVADAMALPFSDKTFAAVVTTGVLEYIRDARGALCEVARVLRPGGVVIATMSLPRSFERLAVRIWSRMRARPEGAPQYIYGRAAFDEIVQSAGLHIDTRRCCCFAPFPLDAVWPKSVDLIDKAFGSSLNRVGAACDQAKTYVIRARRGL